MGKVNVKIEGVEKEFPIGTTLLDISKMCQKDYPYDIVLATVNGKLSELYKEAVEGSEITFLTTETPCGNDAYRRSATLLMLKAFYDICGSQNIEKISVQYSLSKGYS